MRAILELLPASENLKGARSSQPGGAEFDHVVQPAWSLSGLTCIFISHESIHATRVVTSSAGKLHTICKNIYLAKQEVNMACNDQVIFCVFMKANIQPS